MASGITSGRPPLIPPPFPPGTINMWFHFQGLGCEWFHFLRKPRSSSLLLLKWDVHFHWPKFKEGLGQRRKQSSAGSSQGGHPLPHSQAWLLAPHPLGIQASAPSRGGRQGGVLARRGFPATRGGAVPVFRPSVGKIWLPSKRPHTTGS